MVITRSIDKALTLAELEDQLRFLEEGGYKITALAAATNTTDNSEFNEVDMVGRTNILTDALELFTAISAAALQQAAAAKNGYEIIFLSREVFIEGKRVPVGAARKSHPGVGLAGNWVDALPLKTGTRTKFGFDGLMDGEAIAFGKDSQHSAVYVMTDADIDTDGPHGSRDRDASYRTETALNDGHGDSCDSRFFMGVVVPPSLGKHYGIHVGDFAWVSWKNESKPRVSIPCQVYDTGPDDLIGEISVGLAWALGIPPTPLMGADENTRNRIEGEAATNGNDVKDLITVFFPKSGKGVAVSQSETIAAATALLATLVPGTVTAPKVAADIAPQNASAKQAHYDGITLRNIQTLQKDLAERAGQWLAEARRQGLNPYIHIAARTKETQERLYRKHLAGGPQAVAPEKSYHCYGRAFDWVNIKDGAGDDGLDWDNDRIYDKGTGIAALFGIRGIGAGDNDHLQDAKFSTYRHLSQTEFGRFPSEPHDAA